MPADPQAKMTLIIAAASFGLVITIWFIGALLWYRRRSSRAQQVDERLGLGATKTRSTSAGSLWRDDSKKTPAGPRAARRPSRADRLNQFLTDAGLEVPVWTLVVGFCGGGMLVVLCTFVITNSVLLGLGIVAAVTIVFWIFVKHRISSRAALFDRQFVDALDLAARSLRAGHPLVGAFRLISEEFPPPVGLVFAEICQQQSMGVSLENAIRKAAAASSSSELKLLATSVVIQLQTGGNLADVMGRVSFVIRDRMRLNRRVAVLTAQTQFSKRILLGLPFVVFMMLNLLDPEYMRDLYDTSLGQLMLTVGVVCLILGWWTMNRLSVLRY